MRIFMVLTLIFCFGCSDDDTPVADAAVEASVQEASVEISVQEASIDNGVDAQPEDIGGEVVISDAVQNE